MHETSYRIGMENVESTIFEEGRRTADMDIDSDDHAWVQWYQRSWLDVQQTEGGELVTVGGSGGGMDNKFVRNYDTVSGVSSTSSGGAIKKGLIRYLYLVLDYSDSMGQSDYKPNRIDFSIAKLCNEFIPQYFLENPLSYLALLVMRNGAAHFVTRMNGQPNYQIKKLKEFAVSTNPSGQASLVAAIQLVLKSIDAEAPAYASKEMVVLWGSLSSVDPIATPLVPYMVDQLSKPSATSQLSFINIISLSPEVYAVRKVAESLGGTQTSSSNNCFNVCLNGADFQKHLMKLVTPCSHSVAAKTNVTKPVYIKMGFPTRVYDSVKLVKCMCHRELHSAVFSCPQCCSFVCEIPVTCPVCKLTLASKDMLSRVHRMLYEMPGYSLLDVSESTQSYTCFGCDCSFSLGGAKCDSCLQTFCYECDMFSHNSLRHCIGCLTHGE